MSIPASDPAPSPDSGRIAVLLVDDQKFVGIAVNRLLAKETDIDLHCCYTAADALARAEAVAARIIFQDLLLPDVDGLTMVRRFKSHPATAATPIVVLSGNDDEEARDGARAAGADEYLVKLPSRADLVACIRRHTGAGGPAVPAHVPARVRTDHVVDPRVIDEFRQASPGSPDFLHMLIDGYVGEAGGQVAALAEAHRSGDADALRRIAHSLKGSSMTMGAQGLAALCARLEVEAQDPVSTACAAALTDISQELARVCHALAEERQKRS